MGASTTQFSSVTGVDFVLPVAPALTDPPLSLVDEAKTLINLENLVARRQQVVEQMASAQERLESYDRGGYVGDDDAPGEADSIEDARKALEQQMSEWQGELGSLDTALKDQQRFERGFQYLPELSNVGGISIFTEDELPAISNATQGALKPVGPNQTAFGWYDPFIAVGLDSRSLFGWPATDMDSRVQRVTRALLAHESWQVENEWWNGLNVPTNVHLTASPSTPLVSPHRTLAAAFPNPDATPGTVLGTAVGLAQSLASLDQAIADADAGTGMVHATPYVMQQWMKIYPFLRDSAGNVRTVNNNVLVPGYGYSAMGPDVASRTVADAVTNSTSTVTSATAAFADADVGRPVTGASFPAGAVIGVVTNATTITIYAPNPLSGVYGPVNALTTGTGESLTIGGQGGRRTWAGKQWAYATDFVYHLQGDVHTYPLDLREMSPDTTVDNLAEPRAERTHAVITNNLLRAAVLIDTTQP